MTKPPTPPSQSPPQFVELTTTLGKRVFINRTRVDMLKEGATSAQPDKCSTLIHMGSSLVEVWGTFQEIQNRLGL